MSVKRRSSMDDGPHEATSDASLRPALPGQRARNPQGQGARLRTDLIAAADRLLAQTGDFDGLSLRAVAREAGIATPSIYLHFPNKSALVQAVLAARFMELAAAVREAVTAASDPAEQLRAGCVAYCRFATDHPNAYRVLFGRQPAPSSADGTVPQSQPPFLDAGAGATLPAREAGAAAFGFLVTGVAGCMEAGRAPAGDPRRVATNVWSALHGIVSLRRAVPAFPWPPLQQQVDDAVRGLVGLRHSPEADRH